MTVLLSNKFGLEVPVHFSAGSVLHFVQFVGSAVKFLFEVSLFLEHFKPKYFKSKLTFLFEPVWP